LKLKTERIHHREIPQEDWDKFIRQSPEGALYACWAYASLIEPDWEAVIVSDRNGWRGVMPVCVKQKMGLRYAVQPVFSQYWGIFLAPLPEATPYERLSARKKVVDAVLSALPEVSIFSYRMAPEFDYPLPFHWKGYSIETRFTYQLGLFHEPQVLFRRFQPRLRQQLNACKRKGLMITETTDPTQLIGLVAKSTAAGRAPAGEDAVFSGILEKLCSLLIETGAGKILMTADGTGAVLAAGLFGRYREKTLYLAGAFDPAAADLHPMEFLMWNAISQACENSRIFDFEGSMMEGIERFFRKFGAVPVPYYNIYRNQLPFFLKWIPGLR
jgi:hypothetical protein